MTFATGAVLTWIYDRTDEPKYGFYDGGGSPVMQIANDPSFDTSSTSTLRVLLRFWAAAAASTDRYIARVEDGIGRAVPAEEVAVLALLGMWLERTAKSRYGRGSSPSGFS